MGVILLRHTKPAIADGICYGQLDVGVSSEFEVAADKINSELPKVSRVISSPLIRCHRLASYIAARRRLQVEPDNRIMEMNFGTWEGKAWSEIGREELDEWAENFLHARPHGGESVAMVRERARSAVVDYTQQASILMVTHAGVIRSVLSTGDSPAAFPASIAFGSHVILSAQDGRSV